MSEQNVKVVQKEVVVSGRQMFVKLLEIDGTQGWASSQVQDYLGLAKDTFHLISKRLGLSGRKLSTAQRRELIAQQVVSIRAPYVIFWDQTQIKEIAMEAGTEQAKEMIRYAFDVTEALHRGDFRTATALVASDTKDDPEQGSDIVAETDDNLLLESYSIIARLTGRLKLEIAKGKAVRSGREGKLFSKLGVATQKISRLESKVVLLETELQGGKLYALDAFRKNGIAAQDIFHTEPEIAAAAVVYKESQKGTTNWTTFNDFGWVTRYLKEVWKLQDFILAQDIGAEHPRHVFSLADIEFVRGKLRQNR